MPTPPAAPPTRADRPGNLAGVLSTRRTVAVYGGALLAGVLYSGAFPPLEWGWIGWIALIPILWLGIRHTRHPWLLGFVFGVGHFLTSLAWLRTVFVGAPFLLTLWMACYPAFWLWLVAAVWHRLARSPEEELRPVSHTHQQLPPPLLSPAKQVLFVFLASVGWVAIEWIRGWLFTGFPWNFLAISQWDNSFLLPLCRFTGVLGISFLLAAVNIGLFLALLPWLDRRDPTLRQRLPWGLIAALPLFIAPALAGRAYRLPPAPETVRIAAIQGNIPQIRHYTKGQLQHAIEVYWTHSYRVKESVEPPPDLLIWPETAIPAPLRDAEGEWPPIFRDLLDDLRLPMIVGALEHRYAPGDAAETTPPREYNSALFIGTDGQVIDFYDKIHTVPFGEFVPFGEYLPWLVKWIGMGRGLTPGKRHTIFHLRDGVRIGLNICYEDAFPAITRGAVVNGANLLVTVSNDAWYRETSGSRQHVLNAVHRAVETARPVFRSGNNSDTLIVMPDGKLVAPLVDPRTGSPFYRGFGVWEVPVWPDPPATFYTRHGDWFPALCTALMALTIIWCLYRWFHLRQRLYEAVTPTGAPR